MRGTAFARSILAVGFVAFVGSGCEQLNELVKEAQDHQGGGSASTGAAGAPGPWMGTAGSPGSAGGVCLTLEDGGSTSCKDPMAWQQSGADTCKRQNLVLSQVQPTAKCSQGYSSVVYVCCSSSPPAPPPRCTETMDASGAVCKTCVDQYGNSTSECTGSAPGTGGSSGSGGCGVISEGGPGSCKPYDSWKAYASNSCAQQNAQLTDIKVGPTCEGGYESISFTCCGSTMPPPPPPKCGETTDASGQICKVCWYSVTGQEISRDCAGGSSGAGGAGGSSGGQMCINIDDGGPSSCKDAGTWKQYGTDACAQKNLTLTDIKLDVACTGGYSLVSYVCCGAGAPPPSNEMCDVSTNADGSQCKTCYYADGSTVSSCAGPAPVQK